MKKSIVFGFACSLVLSLPVSANMIATPECGSDTNADEYCRVVGENQISSQQVFKEESVRSSADTVSTIFIHSSEPVSFDEMIQSSNN
ncbi:hypothetical protein [Vibrio sp. SCSIO 43136]|uniref:hypothetical protein n=1 Tax=Vibrio sp. SCSIO 43136 TaxID=2819101 RepID=UPI00207550F4|nr:hypothetical protein [Vibrio sp. SCSIO 43136]USD67178.1 hypothetical protein J4N39_21320 [Vibrio sp. SCSIO 43136]